MTSPHEQHTDTPAPQSLDFPGKKIAIGVLIAGVICLFIHRHGTASPAVMWTGLGLILATALYVLYWAIRNHNKRAVTRISILLVMISIFGLFLGYISHQLATTPQPAEHLSTASQTAADNSFSIFTDPLSLALMATVAGLLILLLITLYYRFIARDPEATAKWLPRSRYIRYALILLPLLVILLTSLT